MTRYQVRLHPAVSQDLVCISTWIQERAGASSADRILGEIEAKILSLGHTPHRGSTRDEISLGLRAFPTVRRAVVVFRIEEREHEVLVIAVSWGGFDWMPVATQRSVR